LKLFKWRKIATDNGSPNRTLEELKLETTLFAFSVAFASQSHLRGIETNSRTGGERRIQAPNRTLEELKHRR